MSSHAPRLPAAGASKPEANGPGIASCRCLVASALLVAAGAAQATNVADAISLAQLEQSHRQDVYLAVSINGRPSGAVGHFVVQDGKLMATMNDLHTLGLQAAGTPSTGGLRALDAIPGLRYAYHAGQQAVDITVPPSLLRPYQYGRPQEGPLPAATSGHGLVLNYDAYYQYLDDGQLSLWNDLRYFSPAGVLENTGTAYWYPRGQRYVRFDTSWTHSDPDTLHTLVVGDTITGSLDWTRSVRMGGIQWSKNFTLRPDLVTFPIPVFTGTTTVPSTVDLYVNNIRQLRTQVPGGPFMLTDTPGITGAGNATIVTRDTLGRTVTTTLPLYIDQRMLATGLSAYSIEMGFLRRNYGFTSFDYDSTPAASATFRYGWSDAVTLEGHAEATAGLSNAGAGALVRLGTKGVINAALAASAGNGSGTQATLGYQWIEPDFALDLQSTRRFGRYRDLGSIGGTPVPRQIDQATFTLPLDGRSAVALSYINYDTDDSAPSRIASVAYNRTLGEHVSMNLSAYKDLGPRDDKGFLLGISIAWDNKTSVSAYAGRQDGQTTMNTTAMRTPDYDGGWGWGLQAGRTDSLRWEQAQARYRGRYGEVMAQAQDFRGQTGVSLEATGAAVLMDGDLQLSRSIDNSFALVSTDGASGIPVLHENRVIGTTDGSGHYLVPDLNPYQRNQLSIDGLDLPSDMKIDTTSQVVVPQDRSGVLVTFPISQYRAATVLLKDAQGKALPVGATVYHEESRGTTVVGYGSQTFVEHLQAVNHLRITHDGKTCVALFRYHGGENGTLPTIGPVTCAAQKEQAP